MSRIRGSLLKQRVSPGREALLRTSVLSASCLTLAVRYGLVCCVSQQLELFSLHEPKGQSSPCSSPDLMPCSLSQEVASSPIYQTRHVTLTECYLLESPASSQLPPLVGPFPQSFLLHHPHCVLGPNKTIFCFGWKCWLYISLPSSVQTLINPSSPLPSEGFWKPGSVAPFSWALNNFLLAIRENLHSSPSHKVLHCQADSPASSRASCHSHTDYFLLNMRSPFLSSALLPFAQTSPLIFQPQYFGSQLYFLPKPFNHLK